MNTFGRKFRVSIFGESHGELIGVVLDGVQPGIELSEEDFVQDLARRKSGAKGTTPRIEEDRPMLVSGVYEGCTTGAPLTIVFRNMNTKSSDYSQFAAMPRPGHADLTAALKWDDYQDPRGSGHFSGRLTLPIVAAGVVAKKMLYSLTILDETPAKEVNARLVELGGVSLDSCEQIATGEALAMTCEEHGHNHGHADGEGMTCDGHHHDRHTHHNHSEGTCHFDQAERVEKSIDLLSEDWMNVLFAGLSVIMLVVLIFAKDHFVEEHLWNHIIRKHLPTIFAWTFGVLLVLGVIMHYVDIDNWISDNTALMILLATLIGIIPESGPHMIFVTLFAAGIVPFPVLLASSISQDGHAGIPLLAESKKSFAWAKLINCFIALAAGYAAMLLI